MQVFMELVQDLPPTVEFPCLTPAAVEVSSTVAAALVKNVIDLLELAFPIVNQSSLRPQHMDEVDEDVLRCFNVRIPQRIQLPRPSHYQVGNPNLSLEKAAELKVRLAECLTVPASLLPAAEPVKYSVQQYLTLLALHLHSEEVQAALTAGPMDLLRGLAAGHPVSAYLHNLRAIVADQEAREEDEDDEDEESDEVALARQSLSATLRAQELRRHARASSDEGDPFSALEKLNEAIGLHNFEGVETDEEQDEADEKCCLPRYLRTLLLTERYRVLCLFLVLT